MLYDENRAAILLCVDELCERSTAYGSMGRRDGTGYESARQSLRDELAKKHGIFFSPDKTLCFTASVGGIHYEITGRADGILKKDGLVTLYALSPTYAPRFSALPSPLFMAKCLCLAHMAAVEYDVERIRLCVIRSNAEKGKKQEIEKEYSSSELSKDFMSRVMSLERFARLEISRVVEGRASIAAMHFPFGKLREGQRELIEEVYRAIHDKKRLFAQAPTGIGKTISVLYPAVKAQGKGLCDKIFYLTAKASTRREAFSAVKKMFEAGARLKVMLLDPKDQMCANPSAKLSGERVSKFCSPDKCSFSCGYYSRCEDALYELLTTMNGYTPGVIFDVAKKYSVCPYELSLDLSEYCDIIICDYNYVFDPTVKLRRYFVELGEGKSANYVFLTDEAHNLADRARDMYSSELSFSRLNEYRLQIPENEKKLISAFENMLRVFKTMKKLCADELSKDEKGEDIGFYFSSSPINQFTEALDRFFNVVDVYSKSHPDSPTTDLLYDLLAELKNFRGLLDYYDEHFRSYVLIMGGDVTVKVYCIDPSGVLGECMNRSVSSVLFSATLTPADYFVDVLGGGRNAYTMSLPSPFPRENLCICSLPISIRHSDRDKNVLKVARAIAASILSKKGNYMVYFPSYGYMEKVANCFAKQFPNVTLNIQKRGMTRGQKEEFLDFFKEDIGKMRVGFCVLGGSFSEGVDLPGSRLIGSIIVGVGLPQLSNELNIIRDFYDIKYERGYDYAYAFPGMNKVLQACGRVIRRETDRGIVVLIDDRYETPQYKALFPEHWENMVFASSVSELAKTVGDFWENENKM